MSRQDWYRLTKPGIVYGNSLHVVAGVLFAASLYSWNWLAAFGVVIGTGLVIASACVANNRLDRRIDAKMKRTKLRASASGKIGLVGTLVYATTLGAIGAGILIVTTNWLTVLLGVISYISYVWVYGYAKRTTIHSTLVGSLPGALPIAAGYTALSGTIDWLSLGIFALLFVWQLPHFYAIAIFRRQDYQQAGLPIISLVWSVERVTKLIRWDVALYFVMAVAVSIWLLTWPAGVALILLAGYWLYVANRSSQQLDSWSRQVFGASLVVTIGMVLTAVINLAVVHLTGLY